MSHNITLSDRIKELVRTTGTVPFDLDQGAATGFSPFEDFYSSGDAVFYAATDGTSYEVGSGQYRKDSVGTETLTRFPFKSSNSNNLVSFTPGVKEVYVTYPGKYAVFTGSGIGAYEEPKASGLAFWESSQILNYDGNIVWDASSNFLGVSTATPQFPIDVGGSKQYSQVRASGFADGGSGIMFSGGTTMDTGMTASGGRQLEPFIRNVLATDTNANELLALSGIVDQAILLNPQVRGTVYAGPASGCGCDPTYPTFRYLTQADIPELQYIWQHNDDGPNQDGAIALYMESGVAKYDNEFVFKDNTNRLGINTASPNATLDVFGDVKISGAITSYLVTTSGKMSHLLFGETEDQTWNVAIGDVNVGGASTKSIYVGSNAGHESADTVTNQIGIGLRTGGDTASNDRCIFVGDEAGFRSKSSNQLIGVGDAAAFHSTGCNYTAFIGGSAGWQASGLDQSLGIGSEAWAGARFSDYSQAVGHRAGYLAVELNYSEAIGYQAGLLASGDRNIFIGDNAGYKASGDYNVFIGSGAGYNLNTGSNNLEIVTSGTLSSDTVMKNLSNKININNVVHGDSSTKRLVVGNVALTDYTPNSTLEVKPQNATDVGFIVEGAASQTADLAQWRDVDDNVNVAHITADGSIKTSGTVSASGGILIKQLTPNDKTDVLWNDGGSLKFGTNTVGGETSYSVKFSDGKSDTDTISSADTTHISGVSGIEVRYRTASTNNYFTIGASGLSGVLYDYTSDVSGVMRSEITSISTAGWSLQDGTTPQAADSIANEDIVSISGVSGIDTVYRSATQNMVISASGLSGVMQSQIDAIGAGAGTVSAGSGLTMVGTKMHMDINGSGALKQLFFNNNNIKIGEGSGETDTPSEYWSAIGWEAGYEASDAGHANMIGMRAGYKVSGTDFSNMIGYLAGFEATGCTNSNIIGNSTAAYSTDCTYNNILGPWAGSSTRAIDYSNLIGYYAGTHASGCTHSNMIGPNAGQNASGLNYGNLFGLYAGSEATASGPAGNLIGPYAGYRASGNSSVNMIGTYAGQYTSNCELSNIIGYYAGTSATGCSEANVVGYWAGRYINDCSRINMFGYEVGYRASGNYDANIIGTNAGYRSSGCSDSNMIGSYAGSYSSGCKTSNFIGVGAGFKATGCDYSNIIGSGAGEKAVDVDTSTALGVNSMWLASGMSTCNAIGWQAGKSASGCNSTTMIGKSAGGEASDDSGSVMIGSYAGHGSYDLEYGVLIGLNAGNQASGCEHATIIGAAAGVSMWDSNHAIALGTYAGYQVKTATESIFIGKAAGYQWGGTNALIIKTNDEADKSGAGWADNTTNGVVDIAQIVRGISTGSDSDTSKIRNLRIGAAPTTAELTEVCLGVKAQNPADTVLKLIPHTYQSSPQLESVAEGYDATVINKYGRLVIPVATSYTTVVFKYMFFDANGIPIEHEDGLIALYKHATDEYYQIISANNRWWTNNGSAELVHTEDVF